MRLCFICETVTAGGDGQNLIMLLNHLQQNGHTVSVILLDAERSPDGLDAISFYPVGSHGRKTKIFRERKAKIESVLNHITPDLLIAFGVRANLLSLLSVKKNKIPLILCERQDPIYALKTPLLQKVRTHLYPKADGFVFQTEAEQQFFADKIQQKSIVIPNFINTPFPKSKPYIKERTIVTYTRLDNAQKNLFALFDGFAAFAKTYPEYTLKVYGTGPDEKLCTDYLTDRNMHWNIKFMGEPENLEDALCTAEIFVLTSDYEGMPNTLLSAMALGLACISTNCGGANTLIQNGENGVLIQKGDSKTLAEALCYFAENPSVRQQIEENALSVAERFSPEAVLPQWEAYFASFIK